MKLNIEKQYGLIITYKNKKTKYIWCMTEKERKNTAKDIAENSKRTIRIQYIGI